jgi:hypothetical protein
MNGLPITTRIRDQGRRLADPASDTGSIGLPLLIAK